MSTAYEIPLAPGPQRLTISLGGVQYRLTVKWNVQAQIYILDIADLNGVPILSGVPIVTGADLLAQYEYLGFGGQLIAQTDFDVDLPPGFTNLGTTGHLYWVTA